MNDLELFLPCAAGVEPWLADEAQRITGLGPSQVLATRTGVQVRDRKSVV